MVIQNGKFDDPVPNRVKDTYKWDEAQTDENGEPVLDENGDPVMVEVHPTWKQIAERNKRRFGAAIKYRFEDTNYQIIELELSFLTGQIDDLIKLKGNKAFPKYRLLTRREAKRFLRGRLDASAETFTR